MCASLAAKQIDSIGARTQHDVPWILPKFWVFEVQRLPLARILRVTQHLGLFYLSPDHFSHLLASSPPYLRANAGALLP